MAYSIRSIPNGEAGTDATLKALGDLVVKSTHRPFVRLTALRILRDAGISGRNHYEAAKVLFNWVKSNIRYVNDPVNVETVQSPEVTVDLKAGDCDDHAALLGALAMSIGIPARFKVVGLSADKFQHVYPEFYIGGRWLPADSAETASFGQNPKAMPKSKFYSFAGVPTMTGIGQAQEVVQIDRSGLINLVYKTTWNTLSNNWRQGIINRGDLKSYLRVIDEGNSPYHGTFADVGMRNAIADFLKYIEGNQIKSLKPEQITSLQGIDGFLSSIVKAVGGVVKGAVSLVTGGGKQEIVVRPSEVPAPAPPPQVQQSTFGDLFSNPTTLLALAGLAILIFKK